MWSTYLEVPNIAFPQGHVQPVYIGDGNNMMQ